MLQIVLDEPNDFIKTALLRTFNHVDFPLQIELLFPYMVSDYEYLPRATADALSHFKDKRIHELALKVMNLGQIENALKLLELNFEIEDEILIKKHIKPIKVIRYDIVGNLCEIYTNNKSVTCGDILFHCYRNAECSHCRYSIIKAMINNNVIPQTLLEECNYDSYADTRELIKKQNKNSNNFNKKN